jgi:hypothetical protein
MTELENRRQSLINMQCKVLAENGDPRSPQMAAWAKEEGRIEGLMIQLEG